MTTLTGTVAHLVGRYRDVRSRTEALTAPLSPEDQTVQSMPDTSPTKWHRAHTTWFFETFVLEPYEQHFEPFHPRFGYLFNSYYEAIGDRHPRAERGVVTRPGAEEIGQYGHDVDRRVVDLLEHADDELLGLVAPLIELGTHHEEQHQELILMDIKHVLSLNSMQPAYVDRDKAPVSDPGPMQWIDYPGAIASVGLVEDHRGFAFDNEGPNHEVLLPPYALADRLVTAGEWLEFMADGGYERPELWLSDGWHTRGAHGWTAPLYWRLDDVGRSADGNWRVHRLDGTGPLDPNEAVCHVSFYEADAYATWAGARLATEPEWEHAATMAAPPTQPTEGNFLDADPLSGSLHPRGPGHSSDAPRQLFGDCWEWTGSAYRPFPGYRAPEGAIGEYNGKFMINTMVLKGGSAFTPRNHTRRTYRNFFHPHTRWHLSGVRLADDR